MKLAYKTETVKLNTEGGGTFVAAKQNRVSSETCRELTRLSNRCGRCLGSGFAFDFQLILDAEHTGHAVGCHVGELLVACVRNDAL